MPLYRTPLEGLLLRAGAVMVPRDGWCVAAHFGSPAGELAVCSSGVGLVDRSELSKLELCGYPDAIDQVVCEVADCRLEPNEVAHAGGVVWCSASPDRVFALCEPALAFSLSERLHSAVSRAPGALLTDETDELAALSLLGPSAPSVVAALGAWNLETIGLPQPSFAATTLRDIPVYLLAESSVRVLLLVKREYAAPLFKLLERVGRRYGLSCVGFEAAERFGMIERQLLTGRGRASAPHPV